MASERWVTPWSGYAQTFANHNCERRLPLGQLLGLSAPARRACSWTWAGRGPWERCARTFDRMGAPVNEIRYGLATHYHIDHARLVPQAPRTGLRSAGRPAWSARHGTCHRQSRRAEAGLAVPLTGIIVLIVLQPRASSPVTGVPSEFSGSRPASASD